MIRSNPLWQRLILTAGWALCGLLVLSAIPGSPNSTINPPLKVESKAPGTRTVLRTKPIESIRVGERVFALNPDREDVEFDEPEPDSTWFVIEAKLIRENGKVLYTTLLRPDWWLEDEYDDETKKVWLDLPELGVVGDADVISISSGPQIESGEGKVVTATFKHQPTVGLIDLITEIDSIGVTTNHPFWSIAKGQFVEAGSLNVHDYILSAESRPVQILSIKTRSEDEWVYNIEVNQEHVYAVGHEGLIVHNTYLYWSLVKGSLEYVGIAKNFTRRAAQHALNGRTIVKIPGVGNVNRRVARLIEDYMIRKYGRKGIDPGGVLSNRIRSIAPHKLSDVKKYTPAMKKEAEDILKRIGEWTPKITF